MATEVADGTVVDFQSGWAELELPAAVHEVLSAAPLVQTPETRPQLLDWALGRTTGATDWRITVCTKLCSKPAAAVALLKRSSPKRAMAWPSISLTPP